MFRTIAEADNSMRKYCSTHQAFLEFSMAPNADYSGQVSQPEYHVALYPGVVDGAIVTRHS